MKFFNYLILLLLFAGCGYKPASHFTRDSLGTKVYAKVDIPIKDSSYAIVLTDAIREAIVGRFKAKLVKKEEADSFIEIVNVSYAISELQKNEKGFVVLYRAEVSLKAKISGKNFPKTKNYTVKGNFDFPIEENSVLSENKRLDSIRIAASNALDDLVSKIAFLK